MGRGQNHSQNTTTQPEYQGTHSRPQIPLAMTRRAVLLVWALGATSSPGAAVAPAGRLGAAASGGSLHCLLMSLEQEGLSNCSLLQGDLESDLPAFSTSTMRIRPKPRQDVQMPGYFPTDKSPLQKDLATYRALVFRMEQNGKE